MTTKAYSPATHRALKITEVNGAVDELEIPQNMTKDGALAAIEDLLGRLADLNYVEEAWEVRALLDRILY